MAKQHRAGATARAAAETHRVTNVELFFDLVFVFAITQVTGFLAANLSVLGLAQGVIVLALVWWAWVAYAWLGTTIRFDRGTVRLLLFAAMSVMLAISIGLPEAYDDLEGGFSGVFAAPTVFALAYASLRLLHLGLYIIAGKGDPGLRGAVMRLSLGVSASVSLLVVGSFMDGLVQLGFYAAAVAIDVAGSFLGGGSGWALSPAHFAERHGLIVIIALGESIVAIGAGASEFPFSLPIVLTAALGLAVAACLFWVYFEVSASAAERNLSRMAGAEQARAARDAYSVLHLPMIAGIVLLALGIKKTMKLVGEEPIELLGHTKPVAAIALAGGVALFLLGHILFRRRLDHSWSRPRSVAAGACLVLTVAAPFVPTLVLLASVCAVLLALCFHEYRALGPDAGSQGNGHTVSHPGSA